MSHRLLRNYEEQGLPTAHRSGGGFREYDPDAPAVVRQIRALLAAGLPSHAIRDVLPCAPGPAPDFEPHPEMPALLHTEMRGFENRIACLAETRDLLAAYLAATEVEGRW